MAAFSEIELQRDPGRQACFSGFGGFNQSVGEGRICCNLALHFFLTTVSNALHLFEPLLSGFRLGNASALQFSRLFRKFRGVRDAIAHVNFTVCVILFFNSLQISHLEDFEA